MFKNSTSQRPRRLLTPTAAALLLLALTSTAVAQQSPTPQQTPAPATQTQPQPATPPAAEPAKKPEAQVAAAPAPSKVAAAAPAPLYSEYRGVTLGMSAADVRAKLGKAQEKSDAMDFYVFNERERARVYYTDGKATAVIATYIGKDGGAPPPVKVLGTEVEAKPDGSMYLMTPYPQAGYWVAYSRTAGDAPMVIITMQKTP